MPKKPYNAKEEHRGGKPQDYRPRRVRTAEADATTAIARPAKAKPAQEAPPKKDKHPGQWPPKPAIPRHKAAPLSQPKAPKKHTHWGDVAEWYDTLVGDDGSEYHRKIILPGVLRMLERGKMDEETPRILDMACGQGVLCRRLAEEGCEVTGVDAAAPLLEAARQRNKRDKLAIEYMLADVTELLDDNDRLIPKLKASMYDAVTIVLSIQNITPLSPVWEACHKLLKPGGKLIVVMMHPCFRVPKQSDWHWDEASFTQSRLIRQYLGSTDIEIQTHPGHAAHGLDDSSTTHFHRPLQAYINTMGNAGLYIDNIQEWASHKTDQVGPKKEAIDRAREEIPLFLALRARKV